MTSYGLKMVLNKLTNINNIIKFNITENKIDDYYLESGLNKSLTNSKIKALHIGNNKLYEKGAIIISKWLSNNKTLDILGN